MLRLCINIYTNNRYMNSTKLGYLYFIFKSKVKYRYDIQPQESDNFKFIVKDTK